MHLLKSILLFSASAWIVIGLVSVWGMSDLRVLRPAAQTNCEHPLPRVSIILAARNEQQTLSATLDSLLNLEYPDYEIILVDDDSDDCTGAIADEWANRPSARGRLQVIHNCELPAGWRGKVHAMNLAERAATGEWVLATDADVIFHPSLLWQAMGLALAKDVDLLSLTPELEMQSRAEKVVMPAFGFLLFLLFPPRAINDCRSRRALAAGAFLLMRRRALESLGGYAKLRGTLIEDLRMAEMFKHHGRRIYLGMTRGVFRTRMYENWREVFEGLSRSAWEGTGRSLGKLVGGVIISYALAVLPWVSLLILVPIHAFAGGSPAVDAALLAAAVATALSVAFYYPIIRWADLAPWYALSLPLAAVFYSAVSVASALHDVAGPGVRWKGRRYQSPPA